MKSNLLLTLIATFMLVVCIGSCKVDKQVKFDRDAEIELITASINGVIGWAKDKNFELLYSIIASDSSYLEVDPEPGVIKGFEQFKKNEAFWGDSAIKAIRYEIRDLTINVSENGDFARFYCILDDINEWKGKPASWMNTRWTGVLEKRNGKWIMVQQHFSFASGS